jgi:hypothetical protein
MRSAFVMIFLLHVLGLPVAAQDDGDMVERRGAEPAIVGRITVIDDSGVFVRSVQGATHFVPWDRVRRVVTDQPHAGLERRLDTAETLWRARSRVERNDTALAEPLLERLFEQYRGQTHETALVVAEGLLRCRLVRGANAEAVIPALEVGRLRRADVETASYAMLRPVIDEQTSLCPELAPAWLSSRALDRLRRDLEDYDAKEDPIVSALARGYLQALRRQVGVEALAASAEPGESTPPEHSGVQLLALCAACGADDVERRRAARDRLRLEMPTMPPWAEAWARFALGTSLLREDGVGRRQRGLLNLVHLPARFGRSHPYLAGLSLAWCAEASGAWGDASAAAAFEAELSRRFPNHPLHTMADPIRIPTT